MAVNVTVSLSSVVLVAVDVLPVAVAAGGQHRSEHHPLVVLPVAVAVAVNMAVAVLPVAGRELARTDPRRRHPVAVAAGRELVAVAVAVLENLIRPVAMGVPSTSCPWP